MIHLGGLQKNSLIDYPGKISCVLFLSGCNFNCPYCHNPELARGGCEDCPYHLDESGVYAFLSSRQGFLDGVVISGGEPTLRSDELLALCQKIKTMGYPVKLDTNGSRPAVLAELLEKGLLDYIAMDIKTDPLAYSPLIKKDFEPQKLLDSIGLIMRSGIPYEFRTTCVKPLVDAAKMENIGRAIQGARLYVLQEFRPNQVLEPTFFENADRGYDRSELERFKAIADDWVRCCTIR